MHVTYELEVIRSINIDLHLIKSTIKKKQNKIIVKTKFRKPFTNIVKDCDSKMGHARGSSFVNEGLGFTAMILTSHEKS